MACHRHTIQHSGLLKTLESNFSLVWVMESYLRFWVKAKLLFFVNTYQANLVDVQYLHKSDKTIMCVSRGIYSLL